MVKKQRWSFREHMKITDKTTWMTKDGCRIKVKEMTDSHLVNTVNLLRRHAPAARIVELFSMVGGIRPSGDGATLAFEGAIDELASMPTDLFLAEHCPPFRAMLRRYSAAERRIDDEEQRRLDECLDDSWEDSR